MKKKRTYLYIRLKVQDGERQYTQHCTIITYCENHWLAAMRYASSFFSNFAYRDDDNWYFQGGEVAVRMSTYEVLTKKEYDLLNRILV